MWVMASSKQKFHSDYCAELAGEGAGLGPSMAAADFIYGVEPSELPRGNFRPGDGED